MKIKEIMTRMVEVIHPSDTLQNAAEKMRNHNVGFLPVYNGGELIGVLTDRDIVVRAMAKGADPRTMLSWEMITSPAIYCFEDQSVDDAMDLMHDHQIRSW
jgi:CBS domain-containing protein